MNNKGSTVLITPIIWVMTIFIFIFFIVFSIRILEPFMIYQKISSVVLKYIFIMEDFGKLNEADERLLKKELNAKGLSIERITVDATKDAKDYGEVIELNVNYEHPYKKTVFNSLLTPKYQEEIINICVSKKGVSKR